MATEYPICPLCNREITAEHRAQFSTAYNDLVHVECMQERTEKLNSKADQDGEANRRAKFSRQLQDVNFLDEAHTIVDATDHDLFGRPIRVRINLPAQRIVQINGKQCNITMKDHQKNRIDVSVATGPSVEDRIHLHALGVSWDEGDAALPKSEPDKLLAITFPDREQKLAS